MCPPEDAAAPAKAVLGSVASCAFASAACTGAFVDIAFEDGARFRFHALWLRDACKDSVHVVKAAGERILTMIPVNNACVTDAFAATSAAVDAETGILTVCWNNSQVPSMFEGKYLRVFADVVAMPLEDAAAASETPSDTTTSASASSAPPPPMVDFSDVSWLEPYTGFHEAPAPRPAHLTYYGGDGVAGLAPASSFPRFDHDAVLADPLQKIALMHDLARCGVCFVDGVPHNETDSTTLHAFVDDVLGGMQKDPCREERNWKIVHKVDAKSISYDPVKRLNNHTDQSVTPWGGIPGVVLIMHYQKGSGVNTLADGFAVCEKLRRDDPEAFRLLSTYGNDAERDFSASRADSPQVLGKSLMVEKRERIITLDRHGDVARVQYNEVFRTALTLPFDVFPAWYAAYAKFTDMLHSPEFEVEAEMKAGSMMIIQNWRSLHGRAAARASPDRTVIGGTVTREAFYSRARELYRKHHGFDIVRATKY